MRESMGDEFTKEWNTATATVLAIGLIIGLWIGINTSMMNLVFTILIVSGLYFAVSFHLRDDDIGGGPSSASGAIMGGVLLAGIGICGFIHYFTSDVTITAVGIIAVMLVSSAVMIIRNRQYL